MNSREYEGQPVGLCWEGNVPAPKEQGAGQQQEGGSGEEEGVQEKESLGDQAQGPGQGQTESSPQAGDLPAPRCLKGHWSFARSGLWHPGFQRGWHRKMDGESKSPSFTSGLGEKEYLCNMY